MSRTRGAPQSKQSGATKVWIYTDARKIVGDPDHLRVFATIKEAEAWLKHNALDGTAVEYETIVALRNERPLEPSSAPKAEATLVKTLLLISILLLGCADLVTTNMILNLGLGELNPFMHIAQTWFGAWWLIPKLSLTFTVMWLLWRSNNPYNIALVVAFCCTPVLNNLLIIAGSN